MTVSWEPMREAEPEAESREEVKERGTVSEFLTLGVPVAVQKDVVVEHAPTDMASMVMERPPNWDSASEIRTGERVSGQQQAVLLHE